MIKGPETTNRLPGPSGHEGQGDDAEGGDGSGVPLRRPWERLARQWSQLGPPLRPCQEDMQRLRAAWVASLPQGIPGRRVDILLLGVTPEIAGFPWAPDSVLTALDCSEAMIHAVWPGDGPDRRAVHGDWLRTAFADASFDLVLSDAGLVVLRGRAQLRALSCELRRILRPDGRAVIRHFTRPAQPQPPAVLAQAVAAGEIRNFNELKLRLLTALPGEGADRAVSLPTVLECFNRLFPDRGALAAQLGCSLDIIATIDTYRGTDASYIFPSPAEVAHHCKEFCLTNGPAGQYTLAECCPVLAFAPR